MQAEVRWLGKRSFLARSGSGHGIVIDVTEAAGGENLGPSPMELVLLGLGGCTGFDIVDMLEKMRERVRGCRITLEAERAENPPRVFTLIRMTIRVSGRQLDRAKVERAVKLSAEKYCSVSIMLGHSARIEREIVIEEETP